MKKNIKFNQILMGFMFLMILMACSNKESKQEANKLQEKQIQKKENEKKVKDSAKELQNLSGLLNKEQDKLPEKKKQIENDIVETKKSDEKFYQDANDQSNQKNTSQIESLDNRISEVDKSISNVQHSTNFVAHENRDGAKVEQFNREQIITKDQRVTGIRYIDSSISALERQQLNKQKEIYLYEQTINLSIKKIELLEDEKNNLYRNKIEIEKNKKDKSDLENYDQRISEMEGSIIDERKQIHEAEKKITTLKIWLKESNDFNLTLNDMLEEEYRKNKKIEQFIKTEFARINSGKEILKENAPELNISKESIDDKKAAINKELAKLDPENIVLHADSKTNEIRPKNSSDHEYQNNKELKTGEEIEKDEFQTNRDLLNDKIQAKEIEKKTLEKVKSQNETIKESKEDLIKESKKVNVFTRLLIIIFIVGLLLLAVLYALGKKGFKK